MEHRSARESWSNSGWARRIGIQHSFPIPIAWISAAPTNRHLSFGYGIHFCVGAALARLEGQVALATLIARFPNLALTGEPLEYHGTQVFRALKRLPVTL